MHNCTALSVTQLLGLRDREPVASIVAAHVEQCPTCAQELKRLRTLKESLRALPTVPAPAYDRVALNARLHSARRARFVVAAAAGVAAVCVSLLVAKATLNSPSVSETVAVLAPQPVTRVAPAAEPTVKSWVIRSQELDAHLQRLPRRPVVQRASTSATIDSLQQSIQWVDYQLSLAPEAGMNERQSAELWQSRVRLMDSLVKVRFAEAQRTLAPLYASTSYSGSQQ